MLGPNESNGPKNDIIKILKQRIENNSVEYLVQFKPTISRFTYQWKKRNDFDSNLIYKFIDKQEPNYRSDCPYQIIDAKRIDKINRVIFLEVEKVDANGDVKREEVSSSYFKEHYPKDLIHFYESKIFSEFSQF